MKEKCVVVNSIQNILYRNVVQMSLESIKPLILKYSICIVFFIMYY